MYEFEVIFPLTTSPFLRSFALFALPVIGIFFSLLLLSKQQ